MIACNSTLEITCCHHAGQICKRVGTFVPTLKYIWACACLYNTKKEAKSLKLTSPIPYFHWYYYSGFQSPLISFNWLSLYSNDVAFQMLYICLKGHQSHAHLNLWQAYILIEYLFTIIIWGIMILMDSKALRIWLLYWEAVLYCWVGSKQSWFFLFFYFYFFNRLSLLKWQIHCR